MLVIFKSKAAPDMIMFEENARQILDLFKRETDQGIIMATEMEEIIRILEDEVARQKVLEAEEKAAREEEERLAAEAARLAAETTDPDPYAFEDEAEEKNPPREVIIPVPFSVRAYPFLEMLRVANRKQKDIYWGI